MRVKAPSAFIAKSGYETSDWFGRYRLWFDQLSPYFDDCSACLKVTSKRVHGIIEKFPKEQNWPFLLTQKPSAYLEHQAPQDGPLYLVFHMLSDVCYIDMRNLVWAASKLAPHVENGHFFAYSSGDGDDTWIDEYVFAEGALKVWRHDAKRKHLYCERFGFYETLKDERNERFAFFLSFLNEKHRR